MKSGKVEAVVFDLFHTLVDPESFRPEGFNRAREIAKLLDLEPEAFAKWWSELEPRRHVTRRKVALFVGDYLWMTAKRHCTKGELAEVNEICGRLQDLAILNPDPEVLKTLTGLRERGLKLGLLSNIDEREAVTWDRSPLPRILDAVSFSFEIGHSKPSADAYLSVLNALHVRAASSVYVGDGGHQELRGARQAGFGTVVFMKGIVSRSGIRTPETIKKHQADADFTIMEIGALPELIDRLEGNPATTRRRR